MKAKMLIIVSMVIVLVLAACGSANNGGQEGRAALAGTHWTLLALDGQPLLLGTTITAEFSDEQITGVSGCNSYFGDYTSDGAKLQFDMIGMTAMACLDPEGIMEQENTYAELLGEVRSFRLDDAGAEQRLELLDESGAVLLPYTWQEIPESDPAALIGTQWELLTLDGSPLDDDLRFTLAFEEDRYSGLAGCRHVEGDYRAEGGEISFPSITMLEETCPGVEDAYYALEGQFTDSLTWARYWQIVDGELEIQTARGGVLRFTP